MNSLQLLSQWRVMYMVLFEMSVIHNATPK